MEGCVFCEIVKGEIPAEKVYEDGNFLGFLDINPVNPGHVLLIPKKHYSKLEESPDEIVKEIFVRARDLMKTVKDSMSADYVALAVVGTEVPHFHIHLVPRYNNDGMSDFWPTKKYKEGEEKEVAKKIRGE